ncbi:MAG: phosphoribosylanthranilate isomerase [Pseudomonadota bacterium]
MRTRIKICGLTSPEEVSWAKGAGADAIGLVFYPPSARAISVDRARNLYASIPPFVTVTGLFMNAVKDEVTAAIHAARLDLLQFHGDETPEFCEAFDRPYIKTVPMGAGFDNEDSLANFLKDYAERYSGSLGLLLDSNALGEAGGTGEAFEWTKPADVGKPLILAGGLNPSNVATAIRAMTPYAVDVSSGVEKERGRKDRELIEKFVQEVRLVDREYE